MLRFAHHLLIVAYFAAPVIALAAALWRVMTHRTLRRGRVAYTLLAGVVLGCAIAVAYAFAGAGPVSLVQAALASYFTAALMFLLATVDSISIAAQKFVIRHVFAANNESADSPAPLTWKHKLAGSGLFLVRAALLLGIGLPYVMVAGLTYRPKVVPRENPTTRLGLAFDAVRFRTDDGVSLAGWWVPSDPQSRASRRHSHDVVLLCHGYSSSKAGMLRFIEPFSRAGYNVLLFDFRAYGESDGQITSLGALERADVLAAVRWLRASRPNQAKRILGLGVSTGAAALIEAAADQSPAGQAIDAVAVYEAFDDLPSVARQAVSQQFLPPLSWIADRVGLPLASVQVGADLLHFRPADAVKSLWPRPILVIHAGNDSIVPFERGEGLYDSADQPKRCIWLPTKTYDEALDDASTQDEVRAFFDEARPVPAI